MNLKNSLPILTALFAFAATSIQAQDIKIGLVDMQRALDEYNRTTLRTNEISARAKTLKEEADKRAEGLKGYLEKIQALTQEVQNDEKSDAHRQAKATEREEVAKLYKESEKTHIESGQKAAAELAKQRKDMEVELVGDITKIMEALAGEKGVDLVFDKSFLPRQNKAIIYTSSKVLDMTDEIIAKLNN